MLGIGERTLYRMIRTGSCRTRSGKRWPTPTATTPPPPRALEMTAEQLEKKLKKFGQRGEEE